MSILFESISITLLHYIGIHLVYLILFVILWRRMRYHRWFSEEWESVAKQLIREREKQDKFFRTLISEADREK